MVVMDTLLAQMGWQVGGLKTALDGWQSRTPFASEGGSKMLPLEAITVLGVFFGLLVYAMARTHPTDGWLALLSSVEDAGTRRRL